MCAAGKQRGVVPRFDSTGARTSDDENDDDCEYEHEHEHES
jgi:hypothetical protein